MPLYEIEQYELWTHKVRVTADTPAEAIVKFLREGGDCVDDSSTLDSVADYEGMTRTDDEKLFDAVKALMRHAIVRRDDGDTAEDVISSIAGIEEVDETDSSEDAE